jgi:GT2 family glycosyltransferase
MSGLLRVAVCTNRLPDESAESLAALRSQVPAGALAVVTSGLSSREVETYRAAFDEPILEEPLQGLSLARNRALAWCQAGDLLAFVDDDAVATEGWYEALERRWADAPPEVSCIGGPIRPRWPYEPPDWVSPPILPALTLLDLGDQPRDLDPGVTNVYGANISFRVDALREAGGFNPDFGHSGQRVFFSEEDEAQRALARLGYRTRYVPDAAVWHVIPGSRLTRGSFLRRRFAYGRSLGVRHARTNGLALRQVLSSGAGVVVAAAQRRDALLMERAVRVAENLGVLYGSTSPRRIA